MGTAANESDQDNAQMTRWTLIARASSGETGHALPALDELLKIYLPVLSWYVGQHPGLDYHRREDLVQGFISSRILQKELLKKATPERGRFRTFLLSSFRNYIRDEIRKEQAERRAPPGGHLMPLEDADASASSAPELMTKFNQAWMENLIRHASETMESECRERGRMDVWSVFVSRLLNPILEGSEPEPYDELVERLNLASPSQASNLLITAKRSFSRHLSAAVSETVSNPEDAEAELMELKNCLGRAGSSS